MRIAASKANALYDEPVSIRLEGFSAIKQVANLDSWRRCLQFLGKHLG
jgi:hypothetical protein